MLRSTKLCRYAGQVLHLRELHVLPALGSVLCSIQQQGGMPAAGLDLGRDTTQQQHSSKCRRATLMCLLWRVALQDALIKSLLEMVCVYYRKQAGVDEEEEEVEVRQR